MEALKPSGFTQAASQAQTQAQVGLASGLPKPSVSLRLTVFYATPETSHSWDM